MPATAASPNPPSRKPHNFLCRRCSSAPTLWPTLPFSNHARTCWTLFRSLGSQTAAAVQLEISQSAHDIFSSRRNQRAKNLVSANMPTRPIPDLGQRTRRAFHPSAVRTAHSSQAARSPCSSSPEFAARQSQTPGRHPPRDPPTPPTQAKPLTELRRRFRLPPNTLLKDQIVGPIPTPSPKPPLSLYRLQ